MGYRFSHTSALLLGRRRLDAQQDDGQLFQCEALLVELWIQLLNFPRQCCSLIPSPYSLGLVECLLFASFFIIFPVPSLRHVGIISIIISPILQVVYIGEFLLKHSSFASLGLVV
ncbi:uncharacterized protein LOC107981315 [Nasonia vitripennis]|uniref:Uncharacterized protein n=1 Tax=Nasonia vitripennis TaxID=7425 RepID=A0A7M7PTP4_NASVI|nr:uncharacterized protein LOC107981315 [Nasonia vitripennis]